MASLIFLLLVLPWFIFGQDVPGTIEGLAGALPSYGKTASESALQGPRRVLSAGVGGFYFTEPTGAVYRVDQEGIQRYFAGAPAVSLSNTDRTGTYWYGSGTGIGWISLEGVFTNYFNFVNDGTFVFLRSPTAMSCLEGGNCYLANAQGVFSLPGATPIGWMTLARGAKRLWAKRPGALLAIDASGRRVIGPGGSVLAGSGQFGFPVDGQSPTEAAFQGLSDVVEDEMGRIFVADTSGRAVYRVDGGKIEFVAGAPDEGEMAATGVLAKNARFLSVDSIAVDSRGRLLIADSSAFTVWAIDENGRLLRAAGRPRGISPSPLESELSDPGGLAYDAAGNLYIVDRLAFQIRVLGADGSWELAAGNGLHASKGDGGPAVAAAIRPSGPITIDVDGKVYFLDANGTIRRFQRGGDIETWLTPQEVRGSDATTSFAWLSSNQTGGVVVSTFSEIYRVTADKQVQRFDLSGLARLQPLPQLSQLNRFAALEDGSVVFLSSGYVVRVTISGEATLLGWPSEASVCFGGYFAPDGKDLLVASGSAICRLSLDGSFQILAGGFSSSTPISDGSPARSGSLSGVSAVAAGPAGSVVFAERPTNRVRRYVP